MHTGASGELTTAVRREDGVVLWEASTISLGADLSWIGRLREDATGLFTLNPLTGATVQRVDLGGPGVAPFQVVGVSDTRVVVVTGGTVTAYGMNDLGMAWQLEVGAASTMSGSPTATWSCVPAIDFAGMPRRRRREPADDPGAACSVEPTSSARPRPST